MSEIKDILYKLLEKKISIEDAEKLLKANLIEEIGDLAKLDVFRRTRTGTPEVIYAQNKDPQMVIDIISGFLKSKKYAIISRYNEKQKRNILINFANNKDYKIDINELGKTIVIKEASFNFEKKGGIIGIITAGSSDVPVAAEAKIIAEGANGPTTARADEVLQKRG
ncbi:MAG: hypothetical protein ACFFG0_25650, partial [Candidatus Thorarchaeota archaeon]